MTQTPEDLKLEHYDYHLPPQLVADRPAPQRGKSRLLVYHQRDGVIQDTTFDQLAQFLPAQSTLVFNDTQVVPARLWGEKDPSGGKAEILVLSFPPSGQGVRCLVKCRGQKKSGQSFQLAGEKFRATLEGESGPGEFLLNFTQFPGNNFVQALKQYGALPLPPYIRGGQGDQRDLQDYQTIYAQNPGSVAAPTAGLHFDQNSLQELERRGHQRIQVTLHVGPGTFRPVNASDITQHQMHRESFVVSPSAHRQIKENWGQLIAVGTTSLRCLEGLGQHAPLSPEDTHGETDLFLYPGGPVKISAIRGLITNFHLPRSTLLMLVSAFIGRKEALRIYHHAVEKRYRFFSYGDGMLLLEN